MCRRTRWSSIAALAFGAAWLGCGPSVRAPVDCEHDGPVRILDLDPAESPFARRDDRGWIVAANGSTWAVECAAIPRRVFDGGLREPAAPGLPWMGVRFETSLYDLEYYAPLDPWNETDPELLPGAPVGVSGDAVVLGTATGLDHRADIQLIHASFVEGRVDRLQTVPVTLASAPDEPGDGLKGRLVRWETGWAETVDSPDVVANVELTDAASGEGVAEIDLLTGEARILRADASARGHTSGPRLVVLRETEGEPPREVVLDRTTGLEIAVGREEPGWGFALVEHHAVRSHSDHQTHLVLLPELRELWLPGAWTAIPTESGTDPRRALLGPEGVYALPPDDDTPVFLHAANGLGRVVGADVWVADYGAPLIPEEFDPTQPFDLVRIPLDGQPPEVVLSDVYACVPLAGDTWAAVVSVKGTTWEDLRGELRIIDPARGTETPIADDVWLGLGRLNHALRFPGGASMISFSVDAPLPDLLFARVSADADDRGIFRLAPPPRPSR